MPITGITPSSGPTSGGTTVIITGNGFGSSTSQVIIGGTPATFTQLNGTTIRAVTPPHAPGTVTATVVTPSGSHTGGSFTYLTPVTPTVNGIALSPDDLTIYAANQGNRTVTVLSGLRGVYPYQGPTGGGTRVTILGRHLSGATAVRFGDRLATDVVVLHDDAISAVPRPARASSPSP